MSVLALKVAVPMYNSIQTSNTLRKSFAIHGDTSNSFLNNFLFVQLN